jgi:hypothetical protein
MKHSFEAFHFLSRRSAEVAELGTIRSSPRQRPDIHFEMQVRLEQKPFELAFAQLKPQGPSIGAHQYIDTIIDNFFERRWPMCIAARGEVDLPQESLDTDLRKILLTYPRTLLWYSPDPKMKTAIPEDQRAVQTGYRREYFDHQIFDIAGNRRPTPNSIFWPTEPNDPAGPGVVTFRNWDLLRDINELVWTPILPFPNRTTFEVDKTGIQDALIALQKRYNSHSEFLDAERYLMEGDIKASVRAAASSVDAIIRSYQEMWRVSSPPGHLPFNQKIDNILQRAGHPSYSSIDPEGSDELLHLYRCRSSMHEGDCYYKDKTENRVDVRNIKQVSPWLKTVEDFIVWMDSLT